MIGTLQECAAEKSYCMAIQAEGMVEDFVSNLLNDNMELRKHCASAIFKCAQEEETRALVKSNGGLEPLVALIKNNENHGNKVTFSMHTQNSYDLFRYTFKNYVSLFHKTSCTNCIHAGAADTKVITDQPRKRPK